MHVGQAEIAAGVAVGQLQVVDPEEVEDGGVLLLLKLCWIHSS